VAAGSCASHRMTPMRLAPARQQLPHAPGATTNSPVSILVVDDNSSKRLALKAALLPLGFSIVEADSGLAALRCLMAQDFAVILLDVRMPIMDGFKTAALIRQRPRSELTPIIFITSYGSDEIVNTDLYAEGAVDFIFAPVPPNELRAKVSVFVNAEVLATRAREVQESADQLRLLTDAAPIGIFQTDVQKRYVYTNPRWSEITGIPPEEAVGRDWDTIISSEERAGLVAELPDGDVAEDPSRASRGDLCQRFEIRVHDATSRIVIATAKSIPGSDGGITGWVGTLADVTAEARAEAAVSEARDHANEASQLKSDFLANMSHEIRTPMNGVIGMTDLLLETDLDATQRDYAQTVRTSGEALLAILNDILDFSKVEAGKLEIENIEFNLRTLVDDVVDLLAGPAQTKGLELAAVIEGSVPAVLSGDPGRVRQVLINLVGNAIKFTRTGEIVVRIAETEVVGTDAFVRFEVSDTGDGIEADKLAQIFQPFVQADTSTSRKYGGTGLGLAISGHLIELMGGDCGVTSRPGAGSDFWFTIPVQTDGEQMSDDPVSPNADIVDVSAPIVDDRSVSRSAKPGPSGLILLAEDNPVNQRVAAAMLEHLGFRVDVVADGAEAVKAATLTSFRAILMDCQMPVLDGYEATSEIRRLEGTSPRTPIIAVTASAMKSDQQRCLAAGMDDYLPKPLSLKSLAAMLDRWAPDESEPSDPGEPLRARPVLDAKVVDRLTRMGEATDEDLMGQLATLFLTDSDTRVVELRKAVAGDDAASVVESAHTLRGASAILGATELARLCGTMETNGAAGNLAGGSVLLEAVEAELGRVRSALASPTPTP
jgi:PAS domain S-box-containing protein